MRTQPVATGLEAGHGAAGFPPSPYGDDGDDGHRTRSQFDPESSRLGRFTALMGNPSNWRVRTKLIAILAVPVVAILVFAGYGASSVLTSTRDVNRIDHLTDVSRQGIQLTLALEQERTYTVGYIAGGKNRSAQVIASQRAITDTAMQSFQKTLTSNVNSYTPAARAAVQSAADRLTRLGGIRAAALTTGSQDSIRVSYTNLIDGLNDLIGEIPQGNDDAQLNSSVKAATALAAASDLLSQEQAQVFGLLITTGLAPAGTVGGSISSAQYRAFLGLDTERDNEIATFQANATSNQAAAYQRAGTDPDVGVTNNDIQEVITTSQGGAAPTDLDASKWARSAQVAVGLDYQQSSDILGQVANRIDTLRHHIQRDALISGFLIILILVLAFLAAMVVARSLIRPLLALRAAALDIAGRRLPEAVRRLRDSTDQRIDTRIEPVGIDTDEEIGEVARAFDEVHREAVRLASEQAVLRNNVNAMFVNLSRRSQSLVERQLRLIDDLENREQDPDQLSNLFKLDHLATRMRRNNESLLVLAGTDTARRWSHPVPLNEVVLAAISEVEQYTRVKQTQAAGVSIAGHAVSDVVHLIAELLENATAYSPPATEVLVTSHSLGPGAGAMIEIIDHGIGMPAKDLERTNERLASPPVVDVTVSRTMGLFAVGRLASRHGIRVQLRESESGGITALVRLPARVVTGEEPLDGPALDNEPTVTTRALPGGDGRAVAGREPRKAIPSVLPGESGPLPVAGIGVNGHSNGLVGNGDGGRTPVPAQDLDDLSDLGEISASDYYESDSPSRRRDDPPTGPHGIGRPPADDSYDNRWDDRAPTRERDYDDATMTGPTALTGGQGGGYGGSHSGPQAGAQSGPNPQTGPTSLFQPRNVPEAPAASPGRPDWGQADTGATAYRSDGYSSDGYSSGGYPPAAPDTDDDPRRQREMIGGQRPETPGYGAPIPAAQASRPSQPPEAPDRGGDRDLEETDTTPIFDSVSAWFQRRTPAEPPTPARGTPAMGTPAMGTPAMGTPVQRPAQPTGPVPGGRRAADPSPYGQPDPRRGYAGAGAPAGNGGGNGGYGGRPAQEQAPVPAGASAQLSAPAAASVASGAGDPSWSSAADEGWRAAEAAREPEAAGLTRSGLPIRTPKQNLVPGTAEPAPRRRAVDPTTRSPEAVGGRLASFYQGVRQAREVGDNDPRRDPRENM